MKDSSNVVPIVRPPHPDMSLRLTDEQMAAMRTKPMVPARLYDDPAGITPPMGKTVLMDTPVNKSLRLAQSSKFFEMCEPLLWGDEQESQRQQFGELLRGAVESFLPETLFDLYQLKAIVAAQWRLNRLIEIQSNIFSARAEENEMIPAKYGLPKATADALEVDEEIDKAQRNLQTAISTYRKGQR